MQALSIQQPWAWLIVNGYKNVENRDWSTKQRGNILIHTGKKFDKEGYEWIEDEFPEIPLPLPAEFQKGGIVGKATIVDCVSEMDSPWFFGRFGFVMEGAGPLPFYACNGQLGFFQVGGHEAVRP